MKVSRIVPAGSADVYNMEVEGTHDFAVNGGAIVHNCRYVCMARPISPRAAEPEKKAQYDPLSTDDYKQFDKYEWYRKY